MQVSLSVESRFVFESLLPLWAACFALLEKVL